MSIQELEQLTSSYHNSLGEKARQISATFGQVKESRWNPGTLDALFQQIHKLSGSASLYGFPKLGQTAAALETEIRALQQDKDSSNHNKVSIQVEELLTELRAAR